MYHPSSHPLLTRGKPPSQYTQALRPLREQETRGSSQACAVEDDAVLDARIATAVGRSGASVSVSHPLAGVQSTCGMRGARA